jgi:hypothetical protein
MDDLSKDRDKDRWRLCEDKRTTEPVGNLLNFVPVKVFPTVDRPSTEPSTLPGKQRFI